MDRNLKNLLDEWLEIKEQTEHMAWAQELTLKERETLAKWIQEYLIPKIHELYAILEPYIRLFDETH